MEQLIEWEAYDNIDPIGSWRDDLRTAKLMALIENLTMATHTGKNDPEPKWVTPSKYMPKFGEEEEDVKEESKMDADLLAQQIKSMVASHNRRFERAEKKRKALEAKINVPPKLPVNSKKTKKI